MHTTDRRILLSSTLLALTVGACKDDGAALIDRGSCDVLIECATTVAPEAGEGYEAAYGPDGTCFASADPQAWSLCRDACQTALDTLNQAGMITGETCGTCTSDADCSNFGAGATCDAGYCVGGDGMAEGGESNRGPYVDEWRTELSGPAAQIRLLSIGDRLTSDNFANRGNVEVRYVEDTDLVTIEMQRFTIAPDEEAANAAFATMQLWAYDISSPLPPNSDNAQDACFAPGTSSCYIRAYYDGVSQPVRDGANFRVRIPRGWDGDLVIVTEDNLAEGIDSYPDRGDVIVDGVAGDLMVDMDSGNIQVRMDPNTDHFAGCSANDSCVQMGYPISCGCTEPTSISIDNGQGQASNITVDVGNPDAWYSMALDNRGTGSNGGFPCTATIDCGAFADCEINPDYAELANQERAEINFPGNSAIEGAGVHISLISEDCGSIPYAEGPDDYQLDTFPVQKRGDIEVCVGCLAGL